MMSIRTFSKKSQLLIHYFHSRYSFALCLLEIEILEMEVDFNDACCLNSRPQNILSCGHVVFVAQPLQVVEETVVLYEWIIL